MHRAGVISLLLFAFLQVNSPASAESIALRYDFEPPRIELLKSGYARVSMGDLPLMQNAGKPALPYKPVRVLIPRGKTVKSVEVRKGEKVSIPGRFTVEPAQKPVPLGFKGPHTPTLPDAAVYGSASSFPHALKSAPNFQRKSDYRLIILNIYPVSYIPAEGLLFYYKSLTLELELSKSADGGPRVRPRSYAPGDRESLRDKIDNPEALKSYEEDGEGPAPSGWRGDAGPLGDYPYVIITNDALANASGPYTFQTLRDHRASRGLNSTIVTTEYIYANFSGDTPSGGSDNQTQIRNFIIWAHQNWGTEYVLLGGYSGIIPIRKLRADGTDIPADMYYGNLDGTFDNDADGIYGEPNDGVGGGEVDLYAEVYIGRACVENATDVSNFVRKTIAYETSTSDYLHTAYMVGEHLGFGGDSEYAKPSMEEIRLGSCAHGYCTKGFAESEFFQTSTLYDADGTWSKSQLISIINSGVHILNHLGHANYTYDMKLYTSDLTSLTNNDSFFAYSQGCMPGGFDTANCFAEVVTTMEKGAFAVVMNARYGWGQYNSTAGPSQYYDREFWDALFGEGIRALARMNADSKEDNDFRINEDCMRWCFYELNLFGDPATEVQNISSRGTVGFSAETYAIPATAAVTVLDADLDVNPASPDTATVDVGSTTESTPESLLLTETGPSTKTFRGAIAIAAGDANPGDGVLQVHDGDNLTVTYHDADDGTGNPADVQDTATADGSGPVISNVQCIPSATACTISWQTDEPSSSLARYGTSQPPSTEASDSSQTVSHTLRVRGLQPLTTYYFDVASADAVGNSTTDDNGGAYYQFTTLDRGAILFVDDDEGDPYESYFTSALDANSYSYDVWDVSSEGSSPASSDLDDYQIVIWNCGYDYSSAGSGLTTSEENALMGYMDSGGRVFLCGQDIIYNGITSGFRTNYLHLASYDSDDRTDEARGISGDRISDGMTLPLSYPFYNWSDSINPDSSSSGAFRTDGTTTYQYCATRYPSDDLEEWTFKIVFFAFPFEAISQSAAAPNNAATVMDRVLRFLSPVTVAGISPSYGLNDRGTGVSISGTNFKAGLSVSLGGNQISIGSVTTAQILATVPAGLAAGTYDLLVRNGDSLRGSCASAYTAFDPASDSDGDGLSNEAEIVTHGTNPFLADTDGDGLPDGAEVSIHSTDPLDPDMDDDGLSDGEEISRGTTPTSPDTDGDGLTDYIEVMCGGNPLDGIPTDIIHVNFQPAGSESPEDYVPSSDRGFDARGLGWKN